MKDKALRDFSICISSLAGALALVGCVFQQTEPLLLPSTIFVAGLAAFLALRILFSPCYREGIHLANLTMQGSSASPTWPKKLSDPEWGLFGQRVGTKPLLWIRAILVLGLLPATLLHNWIGVQILWLWFSAALVALELSLIHVATDAQMQST